MKYSIGVKYPKDFLGMLFLFLATLDIYSCETGLKSISFGNPLRLNKPFECSFNPRWEGVPGSAKYMSISCSLLIDFQLENSFPQSNMIDLKRLRGNWFSLLLCACSLCAACLPADLIAMIHFGFRSTRVITALL